LREVRPRTATTFQTASIALLRDQAATALAAPAASLTPDQRTKIRNLAVSLSELGNILLLQEDPQCLPHLQEALDLTPAADHQTRGITENQLGNIYSTIGDTRQALRHYQQAIQHHEARGDVAAAGLTRHDIALLLAGDGRISDALHYARAARHNYQQAGAARDAAEAEQLIADLEQRNG